MKPNFIARGLTTLLLHHIPVSPEGNAFENGILMLSGRAPRLKSFDERTSITIILDLDMRPSLDENSALELGDELFIPDEQFI